MAADNVELSSGSGGAVIRTKARGNVETPVSLIDVGDGSEALVGSGGVCMPVSGSAASGEAASGNPVLIGGQYTNSVVTLDQGDVANLSVDIRRNLNTVIRDASGNSGLKVNSDGSILVSGYHSEDFDSRTGESEVDTTTCFGLAVPSAAGAVAVKASSVGSDLGLNVFPVGAHQQNYTTDQNNTADNTIAFGIAVPSADGAEVIGGSSQNGLLVDLGSNNDVKLSDGNGHPLSSILFNSTTGTRYLGVSAVDSIAAYNDDEDWVTGQSAHFLTGSVYVEDDDWTDTGNKKTTPIRADQKGSVYTTLRATDGSALGVTGGGLNVYQIGSHQSEFNSGAGTQGVASFGIAVPSATGPLVIGGDADGLKVKATISGGDVGIQGRSTGGLSSYKTVQYPTGATAGYVAVSSAPCTAYSITAFNMTATPIFLKLYDNTTAAATDTPVLTYVVPANAQLSGAGFSLNVPQGIAFGVGLSYRASTVLADNDGGTAYPTSGDLVVNILYKA
jgi:hypothetical protein